MTHGSPSESIHSLLHPLIFNPVLHHSATLNLVLQHELQTRYAHLPLTLSSIRGIIHDLEQSNEISIQPTSYHTYTKINFNQLMNVDVLTLLHLPHDGPHRELLETLIRRLEQFIFQVILNVLRLLSPRGDADADAGAVVVRSVNFTELAGVNEDAKMQRMIYFVILNNPALFRLYPQQEDGEEGGGRQAVVFHPNSEFIVGRLFQKTFYRRVVRLVYEHYERVESFFTQSLQPGVEFDTAAMKSSKTWELEAIQESRHIDTVALVRYYRCYEEGEAEGEAGGGIRPMVKETEFIKSNSGSRALKQRTDASVSSVNLFTKERELLLLAQSRESAETGGAMKVRKMMTFRDLFVAVNEIFQLDPQRRLEQALDLIEDENWRKSLDDIHQPKIVKVHSSDDDDDETTTTRRRRTILHDKVGKAIVFGDEVKLALGRKKGARQS